MTSAISSARSAATARKSASRTAKEIHWLAMEDAFQRDFANWCVEIGDAMNLGEVKKKLDDAKFRRVWAERIRIFKVGLHHRDLGFEIGKEAIPLNYWAVIGWYLSHREVVFGTHLEYSERTQAPLVEAAAEFMIWLAEKPGRSAYDAPFFLSLPPELA